MRTRTAISVAALTLICAAVAVLSWLRYFTSESSTREQPSFLESWLATEARHFAMPTEGKELKNPVADSPQVLEEARAHRADHCAPCHANNGSGDTEMGCNLYPKAPDMRTARNSNSAMGSCTT